MNIFDVIDGDDGVQLAFCIGILYSVGTQMATPEVHTWGKRVAAVSYPAWCIVSAVILKPTSAEDLLHISWRGLFCAGFMLTGSWILLSVAWSIVRFIRDSFPRPKIETPVPEPQVVYVEKPEPAPQPEPTKDELYAAAVALRDDNKERIRESHLDPDTEKALLKREDDLFAETLQNILDHA